jgi:uncharacterized membrane protein
VSRVLVVIDLCTFGLTIANIHDPARFIFGVLFGLFAAGWSVVGFLKLNNAALEISLSVGTSLSILMIAAQIMITIHEWHLAGFELVLCVVCLPPLLWHSRSRRRSSILK